FAAPAAGLGGASVGTAVSVAEGSGVAVAVLAGVGIGDAVGVAWACVICCVGGAPTTSTLTMFEYAVDLMPVNVSSAWLTICDPTSAVSLTRVSIAMKTCSPAFKTPSFSDTSLPATTGSMLLSAGSTP